MAESHMLNISNLSGSTRTSGRLSTSVDGRPTSLISEEEGEESDWDSWDEEEDEEVSTRGGLKNGWHFVNDFFK